MKRSKQQPQNEWAIAVKGVKEDLRERWLPDITMTVLSAAFGGAIGYFMSTTKGIIGVAVGLTVAIWVIAGLMIRHISSNQESNRLAATANAAESPKPNEVPVSRTLHDFFKTDFNNLLRATQPRVIGVQDKTTQGEKVKFDYQAQLYIDFDSRTIFLGFYLPASTHTYGICKFLAQECKSILADLQKAAAVQATSPGDRPVELKDLKFSGRVFIYHETSLFESQIQKLTSIYKRKRLYPQFRGTDYAYKRNELQK